MPEGVGGGGLATPEGGGPGGGFGLVTGMGGGFTSPARNAAFLSEGCAGCGLRGLFTRPVESAMNQAPPPGAPEGIQICTPGLYGPMPTGRGTKGGGVGGPGGACGA